MANYAGKIADTDAMLISILKAMPYEADWLAANCQNRDAKLIPLFDGYDISGDPMALKRPICNYSGTLRELADGDTLYGYTLVSREEAAGTKNGTNTAFVIANTPLSGSEQVYLNGILQNQGVGNDYTISGATITFSVAPLSNDVILVTYWR